jgi:membrane-anchored protein YejM (alkaline phosphatase superfamily)
MMIWNNLQCATLWNVLIGQQAQNYLRFLWRTHREQRKVMFFSQLAFTHDTAMELRRIDNEIEEFFRSWINSVEVRNNTLIIIGSDHGNHIIPSSIHSHPMAKRLDRLNSMMYLLVPPWIKTKYPERINALLVNSKQRVTTNIDLYLTLTHLLNFSQSDMRSQYGQTLFTLIRKDTTCLDMGISEMFCGCSNMVKLDLE